MSDLQLFQATLGLGGYKEKIQEHPLVRTNDHPTARRAADQVKPRRINQTLRLLIAYRSHTDLTAEEASIAAKLEKSCYWKRVGELLASGLHHRNRPRTQSQHRLRSTGVQNHATGHLYVGGT
jgi:hypothetical protein